MAIKPSYADDSRSMHPRIDCFTLEPVPVGVCRKREHLRVRVIPKEACLTNSFQNSRTGDLIGVRTEYQICRVDVTSGESQEQVPLFVLKAAAELGRTTPRANVIGVQGYDLPTLMFWKKSFFVFTSNFSPYSSDLHNNRPETACMPTESLE